MYSRSGHRPTPRAPQGSPLRGSFRSFGRRGEVLLDGLCAYWLRCHIYQSPSYKTSGYTIIFVMHTLHALIVFPRSSLTLLKSIGEGRSGMARSFTPVWNFYTGVKKLRVRVTQCFPSIQTNRMSRNKEHDLDCMYNVSLLSWIGTQDISSLGPYNIWHRYCRDITQVLPKMDHKATYFS